MFGMTAAATTSSKATAEAGTITKFSAAQEWLSHRQNRYLAAGLAVVLVMLIGWFVVMSGERKEQFASRALDQARAIAEQGNLPLAASEFQKVITTYGGTIAAQEAVINLNQVRLINGQQELAAVNLQDFIKSNPSKEFRSPAYGLLGRALENAKRPGEAAEAYENASKAAEFDYLKADLLLDAARAYTNADQKGKAEGAYRTVIKDFPTTNSKIEAEIRLAELTAGQM
jgi:outer membrane protein assembly factor BamD (BamD/ComL family)